MTEDEKRDLANRQAMRARRQSLKTEGSVAEKQIKAAQVQKMVEQAAKQAPLAANKPMPLPMSKPIIERKPVTGRTQGQNDYQSQRSFNNPGMLNTYGYPLMMTKQMPDMDAMRSQGATVTPSSGVMRDRAMAIPTATDAANMQRGRARQMAEAKAKEPRSYESFGEFLKTMGLGK
jgi:hypothetical protein